MSKHKSKSNIKLTYTFNSLYGRYSKLVATFIAVASGSFSLGIYYEKVQKDKEIEQLL